MTVYNNLQIFIKLAAIFMICDLKLEESTTFEIVSDLSGAAYYSMYLYFQRISIHLVTAYERQEKHIKGRER